PPASCSRPTASSTAPSSARSSRTPTPPARSAVASTKRAAGSSVRRAAWFLATAIAAGCGGTQKPPPEEPEPPPLCTYATRSEGLSAESRTLPIATWFAFLLPGYKLASGEVTRPLTNCTGQAVRWSYRDSECPDLEADLAYLPPG